MLKYRLALCSNVFPSSTASEALDNLDGPVEKVLKDLSFNIGYGVYLSHKASQDFLQHRDLLEEYKDKLSSLNLAIFTANAFPMSDFHESRVKEKAFLPDWRSEERLFYTQSVAKCLAFLGQEEQPLSISTCPIGYSSESVCNKSVENLKIIAQEFRDLEQSKKIRIRLALESEPFSAFNSTVSLIRFLAKSLPNDLDYIGVCWDLCHSAVIGERYEEVLDVAKQHGVSIVKVQISSALKRHSPWCEHSIADLRVLENGAYFHQTWCEEAEGFVRSYRDLDEYMLDIKEPFEEWRTHCHVPICNQSYSNGWLATSWKEAVSAAREMGVVDFEVETYTLPSLKGVFRGDRGVEETLALEMEAAFSYLELDTQGA